MGYEEANKNAPHSLKEMYDKYLLGFEYFDKRAVTPDPDTDTHKAPTDTATIHTQPSTASIVKLCSICLTPNDHARTACVCGSTSFVQGQTQAIPAVAGKEGDLKIKIKLSPAHNEVDVQTLLCELCASGDDEPLMLLCDECNKVCCH